MEHVYMDKCVDDDCVEMGVKNPMDKYSNYNQQTIEDKETEFINPLSGLKQQLKRAAEESSSTLSASPPSETPLPSASPPSDSSASPPSETPTPLVKIRSVSYTHLTLPTIYSV